MLAVISALVIVRTEGKGVDGRTASSPKGDEAERNPQMQKNFPVGRSLNMFSSNVFHLMMQSVRNLVMQWRRLM
jgi:hypothetical protein